MVVRDTSDIASLLQQQYVHVEEYCNAQTRLYNCAITNSSRLTSQSSSSTTTEMMALSMGLTKSEPALAVAEISKTIELVREDLKILTNLINQKNDDGNNTMQNSKRLCNMDILRSHVDLSQRVIKTIYNNPSWHANGIPATSIDMETNMVALASLKASIARVCDTIGR